MSKKQKLSVEIKEEKEMSSANLFHEKLCKAFILMSIAGGVFAQIGYILAPDSCALGDDTIFETIGVALFAISFFCFPISPIFWLVSLFKSNMHSGHVFFWSNAAAMQRQGVVPTPLTYNALICEKGK